MPLLAALPAVAQTAIWGGLGVIAVLGLLAVVSPQSFARVAQSGSSWVDTSKLAQALDRRIDIDQRVLKYSRLLGAAVLASVAVLGYVFYLRG